MNFPFIALNACSEEGERAGALGFPPPRIPAGSRSPPVLTLLSAGLCKCPALFAVFLFSLPLSSSFLSLFFFFFWLVGWWGFFCLFFWFFFVSRFLAYFFCFVLPPLGDADIINREINRGFQRQMVRLPTTPALLPAAETQRRCHRPRLRSPRLGPARLGPGGSDSPCPAAAPSGLPRLQPPHGLGSAHPPP